LDPLIELLDDLLDILLHTTDLDVDFSIRFVIAVLALIGDIDSCTLLAERAQFLHMKLDELLAVLSENGNRCGISIFQLVLEYFLNLPLSFSSSLLWTLDSDLIRARRLPNVSGSIINIGGLGESDAHVVLVFQ